jgi:hypothetical protein
MTPFTALDSICESGIIIASDGAEYKSKSFEMSMYMPYLYEFSQKLGNLILLMPLPTRHWFLLLFLTQNTPFY